MMVSLITEMCLWRGSDTIERILASEMDNSLKNKKNKMKKKNK